MFKLTTNALGMILAQYRAVFKKCFLKNAAFLAAAALICYAAPVTATDYTVGGYPGLYNYDTLEELRENVSGKFAEGDTITMYKVDRSLIADFDFNDANVTIKPGRDSSGIRFLYLNGKNIVFTNASVVTITGFKDTDSGNEGRGGAVYLYDSTLNAKRVTFKLNSASGSGYGYGKGDGYGGAVYLYDGALNANDAAFEANSAKGSDNGFGNGNGSGGAVYLTGSTLDANGAIFESNSAKGFEKGKGNGAGGAVYLESKSKFNANGAIFESNVAEGIGDNYGSGGAVYVNSNSTFNAAENAIFMKNSAIGVASGSGGAVYVNNSALNVQGATFELNSAEGTGTGTDHGKGHGNGGALYLQSAKTLDAAGATFKSNSAIGYASVQAFDIGQGKGGAVFLTTGSKLNAEKAKFESNSAKSSGLGSGSGYGGAVYLQNTSELNADEAIFRDNSAKRSDEGTGFGKGGAVYLKIDSTLNANGASFESNSVSGSKEGYGGAVYLDSSTLKANGAQFRANTASGDHSVTGSGRGGAVYLDKSTFDAEGAIFKSNSASGEGWLIAAGGGGYGGAVSLKNGTLNAKGASFLNNTATTSGGAIYSIADNSSNTIDLGADAGQVSLFEGNKANGLENSIYFDGGSGGTNILTVSGEGTLDMRDPMNSSDNFYNIKITKNGTGTWKLDGKNEFNANGTDGTTFAIKEGTLELYTGASITIEEGSFSLDDNATLSVIAGKNPAVSADSVSLNSNSILNVSGYNGSQEGDTVTLIQSVAEITKLTNHYTIDGSTNVDYLSAQIRLSNDKDKFEDDKYKYRVLADVALTWYDNRQNHSDPVNHYDQAHGTFTVNGNFELGASLKDRSDDETFTNWDGKTLTKKGAGTLTLTGNNTYSGDTVIEDGTLTIKNAESLGSEVNIKNNGVLNLFASSTDRTTYNINSYSGSDAGVVGIKASLTAEEQWSDLLNFTNTPQSVNVHFYFADGSDATYLPDDGLQFAQLSADGTDDTFVLNGISSLAGASELGITTSNYRDYFLAATFNPSLAKVYSKSSAGELAQASWMHNRELFKATGEAARQADKAAPGIYAGFGRNDLRHETGSYADIKGNTLTLALALQADDKTAWGIFGRKFDGSYTTSHRASLINGAQTIHSDGDLKTHDVGLFAEYRPQGATESGYYYQAIVRAGRSTNDFSTATSYGPSTFRSGRSLYGFSLGGGYAADIGRGKTADYYSHLIYTKLDGDDVTDSIKQHISLQSSESMRLLSGVQFNLNKDRKTQMYFGAALDYEFSGKVDTYIKGRKADGAHLKGLTGILELGLSSRYCDTLTLDLGLQGYAGKKQGLGGTLALSKQF